MNDRVADASLFHNVPYHLEVFSASAQDHLTYASNYSSHSILPAIQKSLTSASEPAGLFASILSGQIRRTELE